MDTTQVTCNIPASAFSRINDHTGDFTAAGTILGVVLILAICWAFWLHMDKKY